MLVEMWERYKRPMIIAETGIEDDERARWFRYIAGEAGRAMLAGVDLHGITWYPIVDHPGWEDNRHCRNGLWGYADGKGERPIYQPLASEIRRQTPALVEIRNRKLSVARHAG
jgi:beta-glucosidase/6-phospho-beta-glucosidase/beta-galactosidase